VRPAVFTPFSSMIGTLVTVLNPSCVVPSRMTRSVMSGSAPAAGTVIVCRPEPIEKF